MANIKTTAEEIIELLPRETDSIPPIVCASLNKGSSPIIKDGFTARTLKKNTLVFVERGPQLWNHRERGYLGYCKIFRSKRKLTLLEMNSENIKKILAKDSLSEKDKNVLRLVTGIGIVKLTKDHIVFLDEGRPKIVELDITFYGGYERKDPDELAIGAFSVKDHLYLSKRLTEILDGLGVDGWIFPGKLKQAFFREELLLSHPEEFLDYTSERGKG